MSPLTWTAWMAEALCDPRQAPMMPVPLGKVRPHMTITWYGQGRPMMPCGLEDTLRFLERVTAVLAVPKWSEATARPFRMARRQGRCVRSQQVPDVGGTHTGEGQSCFPDQMG